MILAALAVAPTPAAISVDFYCDLGIGAKVMEKPKVCTQLSQRRRRGMLFTFFHKRCHTEGDLYLRDVIA